MPVAAASLGEWWCPDALRIAAVMRWDAWHCAHKFHTARFLPTLVACVSAIVLYDFLAVSYLICLPRQIHVVSRLRTVQDLAVSVLVSLVCMLCMFPLGHQFNVLSVLECGLAYCLCRVSSRCPRDPRDSLLCVPAGVVADLF